MNDLRHLDAPSAGLLALAQAVADGDPIDWAGAESSADVAERAIVQQFRVLSSVNRAGAPLVQWGPLQLVDTIGAGTFGTVYRAIDTRLDRKVALKLLDASDETLAAMAVQEGRLLARVRHPNVVVVFGADVHDGRAGIWMEHIQGRSLKELIATNGQLGAHEAALVGRDLCRALAAVHGAGLVHGDIKAQNVLREQGGRIVLMDFGAAQTAHGATVALRGTPAYLAPELLDGESPNPLTDIYGLGVLIWHLVSGAFPVTGSSLQEFRDNHVAGRRTRLLDTRPDLPDPFVRALEAATAKDPAERPQTAAAFERMLADALGTSRAWPRRTVVAALLAVVAVAATVWAWNRPVTPRVIDQRDSVAILPLRNLAQASDDFLSAGLTADLIGSLSSLRGLRVIAGGSVLRYADRKKTPLEIGQELGVRAVLDANLRRSGETIRVVAELIDARTGEHLWSDTFDSSLAAIVELKSDVANKIALALRGRLSPDDLSSLRPRQAADAETVSLCMRGRYERSRRTDASVKVAIQLFDEAILLSPTFAPAHAGLADAYTTAGVYGYLPRSEAFSRAASAAERAVQLDSELAEAHAALGYARKNRFDWDGAEASFKRAIALKPSYAEAHHWYSVLLTQLHRFEPATLENQIAISLDPLSLGPKLQLASLLTMSHRYRDAIAQYSVAMQADSGSPTAFRHAAKTYTYLTEYKTALSLLDQARIRMQIGSEDHELKADLGYIYAVSGNRTGALAIASELAERFHRAKAPVAGSIAAIHAGLGEVDKAVTWLERALATDDPELGYLNVEPRWDNLRHSPAFVRLLRLLRFPTERLP